MYNELIVDPHLVSMVDAEFSELILLCSHPPFSFFFARSGESAVKWTLYRFVVLLSLVWNRAFQTVNI